MADPNFRQHIEDLDAADAELSELLRNLNQVTSDMRFNSPAVNSLRNELDALIVEFRDAVAVGVAKS